MRCTEKKLLWNVNIYECPTSSSYESSNCQVDINLSVITWLRYTLFIVLYPIGVTGELLCYYVALPRFGSMMSRCLFIHHLFRKLYLTNGNYSIAIPNCIFLVSTLSSLIPRAILDNRRMLSLNEKSMFYPLTVLLHD